MKNAFVVLMTVFFLAGCAQYGNLRQENRQNLNRVDVGMTKDQVLKIMGEKSTGEVSNPYKRETIPGKDSKTYDVLYYYTEQVGDKSWETGVTPVVFVDGKVIGVGWKVLDDSDVRSTLTIKRR